MNPFPQAAGRGSDTPLWKCGEAVKGLQCWADGTNGDLSMSCFRLQLEMWGSQTAFHWGHSCWGATPADGQKHKRLTSLAHTPDPQGPLLVSDSRLLNTRRLWDISRERSFLLINLQSESLQCLKMEIEAQKVKGSRRYSRCVAEFHSGVDTSLAPLQVPGLHGRDILRKHEDGASLGLFIALSWNRVQHGHVESVSPNKELSHACWAVGFRVRLAASIPIPNPQFPGLFPWTRHQISQWRCAHLESKAKSCTYLVRILWGL